jgi:hypothetical protein
MSKEVDFVFYSTRQETLVLTARNAHVAASVTSPFGYDWPIPLPRDVATR